MSLISGCNKPELQRCVDKNNRVVDDSFCANLPAGNDSQQQYRNLNGGGYVPYRPLYRFYYGGWGGYTPGTVVGGGSTTPVEGHSYISSRGVRSGTVRGGFGHWFSSHSSSHGSHGGGG